MLIQSGSSPHQQQTFTGRRRENTVSILEKSRRDESSKGTVSAKGLSKHSYSDDSSRSDDDIEEEDDDSLSRASKSQSSQSALN